MRAETRNANQCARASPTVTPQMIPMTRAWASVSGNAAKAASRQIATYSAIVEASLRSSTTCSWRPDDSGAGCVSHVAMIPPPRRRRAVDPQPPAGFLVADSHTLTRSATSPANNRAGWLFLSPHPCRTYGVVRPAQMLVSMALIPRYLIRMRPLVQVQPGPLHHL